MMAGPMHLVAGLQKVHLVEIGLVPAPADIGLAHALVGRGRIATCRAARLSSIGLTLSAVAIRPSSVIEKPACAVARHAMVDLGVDRLELGDDLLRMSSAELHRDERRQHLDILELAGVAHHQEGHGPDLFARMAVGDHFVDRRLGARARRR